MFLGFDLQLLSEGGGASSGASADGSGAVANASVSGVSLAAQSEDLSSVVYGKSSSAVTQPNDANPQASKEDKTKAFDDLIKKGGQYADEFNKRTQTIIDKRFAKTKELEKTLQSHQGILDTLSLKYGVDASDIDALSKAINEDDSLFEEAAFKEGLTTKQYRDKLNLERENKMLKEAEDRAKAEQHSQEIYANWLREADAFSQKYGIADFDLSVECQNPMFAQLVTTVGVEGAYKAVHFDDMVGGAMARTAQEVTANVANNISQRQARPSEGMAESSNAQVFKSDVNKFSDNDINEIIRRVRLGEEIHL